MRVSRRFEEAMYKLIDDIKSEISVLEDCQSILGERMDRQNKRLKILKQAFRKVKNGEPVSMNWLRDNEIYI